ncbi:MAG: hypothetical protein ACKOGK_05635 [Betaproteobacteria bacterium]
MPEPSGVRSAHTGTLEPSQMLRWRYDQQSIDGLRHLSLLRLSLLRLRESSCFDRF